MTALAFSDLAARLLADHRRRRDEGSLEIIPIVAPGVTVDDAGADILGRAVLAEDGLVLEARELARGVSGIRTSLADEIERLLPDLDEPDRPRLSIQQNGETVTASLPGGALPIGSGGLETLAGCVLAPFDARLRAAEIALLRYDEAVLDRSAADAVWQMVCLRLSGHDFGSLRTLIVVCHAPSVEAGRHFAMIGSARFIVRPGRVSQRRPWRVDREEVRRLAVESAPPIVLFLGAGFSASSQSITGAGLPMGNELRDRALRRLVGEFTNEREAATLFREYCASQEALLPGEADMSVVDFERGLTFERVLNVEFAGSPDPLGVTLGAFASEVESAKHAPGAALVHLRDALDAGRRLILITVNLDDLTEHVCGNRIERFVGSSGLAGAADAIRDYIEGADTPAPLIKLHGDLGDATSIVATVQSVARGLSDAKVAAIDALLGPSSSEPRRLFYVGASMRDRDIAQLIGLRQYAELLDEWWVAPSLDSTVETFMNAHRLEPWERVGRGRLSPASRCITLTADVFMEQLKKHLV